MGVYISAYSLCCAQGDGAAAVAEQLSAPRTNSSRSLNFLTQNLQLPYFKAFDEDKLSVSSLCRLIEQHILQALQAAGKDAATIARVPIFLGSTAYVIAQYEITHAPPAPRTSVHAYDLGEIADYFLQKYGNPHVVSCATSCTSSANALLYARNMIERGWCEEAMVVGFETFNDLTLNNFYALGLLADNDYLPLLQEGFVLGEGIAALLLQKESPPGGAPYLHAAQIRTATDSFTSSRRERLYEVMSSTLQAACIAPEQVNLIKPCALGSDTDHEEIAALQRLFPNLPPLALLKPFLGYTLGASTVLETVYLLICLQHHRLPELPHAAQYAAHNLPLAHTDQPAATGYALINTFGFGGSNACLLLEY
ncbi:MAG: beta-ketoacyl synthase N-terminal-like domain-containing protein [Neisseria sp.]|nr:beta-ketoacyl synthase N-terminal-like domain-containing protein [Neisseria sp.]